MGVHGTRGRILLGQTRPSPVPGSEGKGLLGIRATTLWCWSGPTLAEELEPRPGTVTEATTALEVPFNEDMEFGQWLP